MVEYPFDTGEELQGAFVQSRHERAMTMAKKGLMSMTDAEIMDYYRQRVENVDYSLADCERELDRRATNRHNWWTIALTIASTMTSIIAVVISLYKAG